jgi:predicted DNA-binding transcriptional regulator AlpA
VGIGDDTFMIWLRNVLEPALRQTLPEILPDILRQMKAPDEELLSTAQVSTKLGISKSWIYTAKSQGRIVPDGYVGRLPRYRASTILAAKKKDKQ